MCVNFVMFTFVLDWGSNSKSIWLHDYVNELIYRRSKKKVKKEKVKYVGIMKRCE